ncbi:MAG: ABC transporter substrate-binding protein, partial [Candidatus Tectomicrobia bacterium]|nr:ABC transporter substrate-binding protein [Candidatus Tectomicrobia bacterium]
MAQTSPVAFKPLPIGACFLFSLALCLTPAGTGPARAAEKIRLAMPVVGVQYAPFYFGSKQGIYGAEGLELEFSAARTDLALAALGAGQIDYLAHGGAALRAAARGFPLKLVYALDDKAAFWLATRPEIQNNEALKGKKIGVSFPGDTPHIVLKRFLRKQGLDPEKDVIYVSGQFSPIGLQGLMAGALDAAVLAPPFSALAEEKGLRILAFLGKEVPDAPTVNGLVTSEKKIRSQPQQVKRLVRATLKSVQLYRQQKDLGVAFLAAEFKLSNTIARKVYH